MPDALIDRLVAEHFEHLAIVGMEPFLNAATARKTCTIAEKAGSSRKSVSAITNGLGLNFISCSDIAFFDFVDVSFDGGPNTYERVRGGSYPRLCRNLTQLCHHGARFNAIHVLYAENLLNITDMMRITGDVPLDRIMFSPYMVSANHGANTVKPVCLAGLLSALARNDNFIADSRAFFLLDQYHLDHEGLTYAAATELVASFDLVSKVHFVPATPLAVGSLRVTYDGLILSPKTALHTRLYRRDAVPLMTTSLSTAYDFFLERERKEPCRPAPFDTALLYAH